MVVTDENSNIDRRTVHEIRDISARVKAIVEHQTLGKPVWIGGFVRRHFISDIGHEYFDLVDEEYTIRCMVREPVRGTLDFSIGNGMELEIYGTVRFYERYSQAQIEVETATLIKRHPFLLDETTREQLEKKGLWPRDKRPLPHTIQRIGLITSKNSQALHDFENTYRSYGGTASIEFRDVRLQGQQAPREIADAIRRFNHENDVDVIVITRGGGRMLELAVFNDALIAEAICRSEIPVVTGIGHERDDTFADQVADVKEITPTAAALYLARERPLATTHNPANRSKNVVMWLAAGIILVIIILLLSGR
ncbi:MAG: exodeoxyribonuclease VII large subunit [Chloroflexi bacterium]|nr:MAG: exodeoxyribonuclease VII large subunit [Phototrophicales bacterium]RMF80375.1 MAG: exodeoxyribonuclease VII large subunit [Chloroflexota bacterium]